MRARPKSNPGVMGPGGMSPPRHHVGQALSQKMPYALEWGSRPSTTNNSNFDKIVTSPFDPRYPTDDAPVAQTDFISVVGGSDLLPISLETKGEAAQANKIRLLNKEVKEKPSVETMEELMMHQESKGMGAARLRKVSERGLARGAKDEHRSNVTNTILCDSLRRLAWRLTLWRRQRTWIKLGWTSSKSLRKLPRSGLSFRTR